MLLPQRSQGSTLEASIIQYCNVVYNVDQTNPVSPVYMASTSQTASRHYQAVTPQPKLQKALRNRKPLRGL